MIHDMMNDHNIKVDKNANIKVSIGKIISISTIDWHRRSSHVIFFNGCPLRCPYCQNYKLLDCKRLIDIEKVEKGIIDAKMFISAVVFSGGEPTMQPDALLELTKFIKGQGLLVGIQTNGYFPDILRELAKKKLVDKIFLDIKASPLESMRYSEITNAKDAYIVSRVIQTLHIPDIDIEVRTTIFRSLNDSLEIAKYLEEHNYNGAYVIQQGVPWNTSNDKIRKEDILKREEIISIAKNINTDIGLKGIKIRTRENGEEYIV
jgi:pyruvate formate lyase activating enzyme